MLDRSGGNVQSYMGSSVVFGLTVVRQEDMQLKLHFPAMLVLPCMQFCSPLPLLVLLLLFTSDCNRSSKRAVDGLSSWVRSGITSDTPIGFVVLVVSVLTCRCLH